MCELFNSIHYNESKDDNSDENMICLTIQGLTIKGVDAYIESFYTGKCNNLLILSMDIEELMGFITLIEGYSTYALKVEMLEEPLIEYYMRKKNEDQKIFRDYLLNLVDRNVLPRLCYILHSMD